MWDGEGLDLDSSQVGTWRMDALFIRGSSPLIPGPWLPRLGSGSAVLALLGVASKVTTPVSCDKSPHSSCELNLSRAGGLLLSWEGHGGGVQHTSCWVCRSWGLGDWAGPTSLGHQ